MIKKTWWKEAIGYEIYPKSFADSNQDGVGDIRGVIDRLPYLKELGVDLIWICPFYPSPMKDNGYDVADYCSVHPLMGTMRDIEELLEKAHHSGIRVIIDMVLNHTSDQHPWFREARKDPKSPYRDYYIFSDSKERPSNGRSCFGGSVWEPVPEGGWYYHTFAKSQPDLNWENQKLREEIYKILNFWLDKGVSGFRLDAITYIKKGASMKDAPPDGSDGLHNVGDLGMNQPGIGEFLREMKERCFREGQVMTVAEAPGVPYEELGTYVGEDGYFSMVFDFSYADIDLAPGGNWYNQADWNTADLKKLIFHSQESVQREGWGAVYLENHDQSRSLNKYFREKTAHMQDTRLRYVQATALATLLFGLRGTVFLYQGEELGMANCPFTCVEEFDDLNTVDQYHRAVRAGFTPQEALKFASDRSRDNSRTPMPWSKEEHGGFSTVRPWIKMNPEYKSRNVQEEIQGENTVFHYYQKLIRLKKSEQWKEALVYGKIAPLESPDSVIAFERQAEDGQKKVQILVNVSEESVRMEGFSTKECLIGNYHVPCIEQGCLVLRPYEGIMLV